MEVWCFFGFLGGARARSGVGAELKFRLRLKGEHHENVDHLFHKPLPSGSLTNTLQIFSIFNFDFAKTPRCEWHHRVHLRRVIHTCTAESKISAVSCTLRSPTPQYEWHSGVRFHSVQCAWHCRVYLNFASLELTNFIKKRVHFRITLFFLCSVHTASGSACASSPLLEKFGGFRCKLLMTLT